MRGVGDSEAVGGARLRITQLEIIGLNRSEAKRLSFSRCITAIVGPMGGKIHVSMRPLGVRREEREASRGTGDGRRDICRGTKQPRPWLAEVTLILENGGQQRCHSDHDGVKGPPASRAQLDGRLMISRRYSDSGANPKYI